MEQRPMEETLDAAIQKMAEMTKANAEADKALKYSQAALNLAQVKQIMEGDKKKRASA